MHTIRLNSWLELLLDRRRKLKGKNELNTSDSMIFNISDLNNVTHSIGTVRAVCSFGMITQEVEKCNSKLKKRHYFTSNTSISHYLSSSRKDKTPSTSKIDTNESKFYIKK